MSTSSKKHKILIKTPFGDIKGEIFEDKSPVTSKNYLRYVNKKLYDKTSFLRTVRLENQKDSEVKIELISGGVVPKEKSYPPIDHETTKKTGIKHLDGTISMSRGEPGSAASRFFICVGDQPELDYGGLRNPDGHAAFGQVIEGMDVVRMIHQQQSEGQALNPPIEIISVRKIH
jgi:peptidyl-prolyl cis-trans isomerase A (cyclophilin A)